MVLVFPIRAPLGPFLGVLLGSFELLESKTGSLEVTKSRQANVCQRNPGHFGEFWHPLGRVFGFILASFFDILFAILFYKLRKRNLMDFETFLKSKNEHFACEGLQKSKFRIDEYAMLIGTDFG